MKIQDVLSANRQEALARIRLYHMRIVSIRELDAESGADAIQRYQVELYVERMEFEGPGAKDSTVQAETTNAKAEAAFPTSVNGQITDVVSSTKKQS